MSTISHGQVLNRYWCRGGKYKWFIVLALLTMADSVQWVVRRTSLLEVTASVENCAL